MKKMKRILALAGVVFLAGMYLVVFILGLTANPATQDVLMAAIACTIIIPCLLYGMMLVACVLDNRKHQEDEEK
ncbi:MAG: hypothetical protein Q4C59_12375 [Lachnospiraceae bacterium]|nr:hypothetical protein [Lachnospiraceae bacterium]